MFLENFPKSSKIKLLKGKTTTYYKYVYNQSSTL